MAKLSFVAVSIDNEERRLETISSYEFSRNLDAPCDGLRITVSDKLPFDEIKGIKAYCDDELIFNGFVDTQRETANDSTYSCFIYARSSACVLLDNEAEPRSYSYPTAYAIFQSNIADFGFEYGLPELSNENSYLVNKGVSCFGALNNFVYGMTGKSIIVTPNNKIMLAERSGVFDFSRFNILSEKRIINRGELLSRVDYKIEGDSKYSRHTKSSFLENRDINTSKKINLSNLPLWQRENNARTVLSEAMAGYQQYEIVVDGCAIPELSCSVKGNALLDSLESYYVSSICVSLNDKGEQTKITLCKRLELEDITYVAE